MTFAPACHLAATCALMGLIWTVQIVIYPLFDRVGRTAFAGWHEAYMRHIGYVVGPLMLVEAGTAAWLLWDGRRDATFVSSVALLGLIWISTAVVQVPLHRRLARGFEAAAHRRLVRTNWLRTLAWSLRGLLLLPLS
jgi:hypothetical protein